MTQGIRFLFVMYFITVIVALPWGDSPSEAGTNHKKTTENYTVPDVTLVDQNGAKVRLKTLLNSNKPALMDFVFTTCTTVCPVLSAGFSNFQRKLGAEAQGTHLVSISIDPENDTPKKMKEYLQRYDAKQGWVFLTGSRKDIGQVINAFNANTSSKMSHLPIVIIWSPMKKNWTRIDGLVSTADLIEEYRKATVR